MSNSVRPHRRRPTRLPCPWDSLDKNTGVVCHFLLQCMKVKGESEVAQLCLTLSDPMDCSLPVSSVHGILPSKNTGVGSYSLLQEIFTTQGLNPCLLHCKQILYHLSHHVSPKEAYCRGEGIILEKCSRKKMGGILLYGLLYFLTALMILVTYHNTPLLNFTHYLFTVLSCANVTTV